MIYSGRAGMWQDWLKFQQESKHKRIAAEKAELRAAQKRKETIIEVVVVSISGVILIALIVFGLWIGGFINKVD